MLRTRAIAEEQMDAPDLAPDIYARVLNDLARVNDARAAGEDWKKRQTTDDNT